MLLASCANDAATPATTTAAVTTSIAASTTSTTTTTSTSPSTTSTTTTIAATTTVTAAPGDPYLAPDGLFAVSFLSPPTATQVPEAQSAIYIDRRPNNDQFSVAVRPAPTVPVDLVEVMNGQLAFIGPNAPETADVEVSGRRALSWSVGSSVSATHVYGLVIDLDDRVIQVTVLDDEGDNAAEAVAFIDSFTLTA